MLSNKSLLSCASLENATDSTEEKQPEVLATLAHVPAKATFSGDGGDDSADAEGATVDGAA